MTSWRTRLGGILPSVSGGDTVFQTEFSTCQQIIEKVCERRLGFNNTDSPPLPWRWDRAYVRQEDNVERLPCPDLERRHLLSLPREYWQNGPIAGKRGDPLKIKEVKEIHTEGRPCWAPVILAGDVNIWRDSQYLFSDDSVAELLSESDVDDSSPVRSRRFLLRNVRSGSHIGATVFRRLEGELIPWRDYSFRSAFSSIPNSDREPQTTVDGPTIFWDVVDTTKLEFITYISDERTVLHFNSYIPALIGSLENPASILDFHWKEYLGYANGINGQSFESEYFPMSSSSFRVWAVDATAETWTEYVPVIVPPTANDEVRLDPDTGTITFGDGVNGAKPPYGEQIYIGYRVVPRIDYEEEGLGNQILGTAANVSPLASSLNRGFVVISRAESDVHSILLETDKEPYLEGTHRFSGSVTTGADYASLIATVKDAAGNPLADIDVHFFIKSALIGAIGGVGSSLRKKTLPDGKARTFYVPPSSANSLGHYVKRVDGGNTLSVPLGTFTGVEDIYTYRVLKDDPILGKIGADEDLGEVPWESDPPNGRKVIIYEWDATAIHPVTGVAGAFVPVRPTAISTSSLTYGMTLEDPDLSTAAGSNNLGAYWVVANREVTICAKAWSRRHRRWVYSNDLTFKITLPDYMKGSYITPSLDEIPFGWRITGEGYSVAAAVDGATYITINPVAGPYPIVDVIDGETINWGTFDPTSDPHVSAPFGTLTIAFTVNIP